jgi:riboflavin biosynthesis pyrimidine reductase
VLTRSGADGSHLAGIADVVPAGAGAVALPAVLDALSVRGCRHVLCEGGPTLFGELVALDLVDELCLTLSPQLTGAGAGRIVGGPPSPVRRLALANVLVHDDELFLRYRRA